MIVRTMSPLYVFILFFLWISLSSAISNVENIQNKCKRECSSNVIEGSLLFCDEDCRKKQCQDGCTKYTQALSSSCQSACIPSSATGQVATSEAETRIQKQNCIQGCTFALDIYYKDVIGNFRNLPRPDLNRSSKKYSSVVLRWTGRILKNIKYYVQRKIMDIPQVSKDWQIHNSSNFSDTGQIYIYNLHPYVTYKFRVLVVISPLSHHILESPETFAILTLAHGAPSSAPKITSLSAPSPSVLSISWTRPPFTNGEIIAYKITINPINHKTLKPVTKDILGDTTSWTVGQLQPSQKYVVTVAASNSEGEGPADVRSIRTPNPGNLSANETPFLILGAANKVLKQNLIDIISLADTIMEEQNKSIKITGRETLYESESGNITGIGIHIRRQMFIISDSGETVQQVSLSADSTRQNIYPSILKPTAISVDWLNDRVYIVSRSRIFGCPLDRDNCIVVVDNLERQPYDVKVDPVNGYLYFTQDGKDRGLYRIDLADINPKKPITPLHIVEIDDLQSFVIDFENVRIYFPNNAQNTMMSAFVDGTDIENIRPRVMRPNYRNILSLTYYDNVFYWTNGTNVIGEEYDSGFNKFRHNELLFFDNYFRGFNLYHPRMQPSPVPHDAPGNLQALFGPTHVYIKWESPPYLQYQGRGAWNKWDYELYIYETENSGEMESYLNSTGTEMTVEDLTPNTTYSIRVRAVSEAGLGPWSQYFIGRTLKQAKIPVRVLMSTKTNIVEKDLYEDTETTLYNFEPLTHATDIAWHNDLVMYTSNHGFVNIFDKRTSLLRHIPYEADAECLAYDWLGQKIFWSEPKPGVIKRSDLNVLTTDTVYQAAARDMAIDSAAGRIYWVTTNSIESTFLNGEDLIIIYSVPYFQGKHIISLVLNFDLQKVFWYVKAFENQDLFVADLVSMEGSSHKDIRSTVRTVGDFKSISTFSSLQYYSHHLFWMDGTSALVVGDLRCNYTSPLSPHNSNITAFSVKHPTIQSYPDGLDAASLRVIPKPMKSGSIKVYGPSSSFNLTWDQDPEVNFGKVFYKVFIQVAGQSTHIVTGERRQLMEGLSPYTQMTVSIQPYTYWGYAEPSTVSVRSPMGVPTEPLTPRVYVTQHKNTTSSHLMLAADFRWSNPQAVRGVLNHHEVFYWEKSSGPQRKNNARVDGVSRHFILNNILDNRTYFFQVKACTLVGCGPLSDTVSAVTNVVNPVPRLLIATKSSVQISEMDGHFKESTVLLPKISPTAMTFLAQDERTFWIEKASALFVSKESAKSELKQLNGSGKDLSIDWISRTLYIVEDQDQDSRIMGYDIDKQVYRRILNRISAVGSVLSDPYSSSLFWSEKDKTGHGHIYHQPFNSDEVINLLGHNNRQRRFVHNCTCTDRLNVSPVVAMDYSNSGGTEIIFTDLRTYSIMASDGTGCRCRQVFQASPNDNKGLPPSLLAVDHLRVYWYNSSLGRLYSVNKNTGLDYFEKDIADVQDIVAYGDHLQPLPDSDCLDPGRYSGKVQMTEVTNVTLSLQLDTVARPPKCGQISSPQNKYTIYYKDISSKTLTPHTDCSIERDACSQLATYDRDVKLTGLSPYTEYLVQVAVSNYYTEYLSEAMGKGVILKTLPGVPSEAKNVQASVMNPETIRIEWRLPARPNGPQENITYVVKWSTKDKGVKLQGQTYPTTDLHIILPDLLPNHLYTIKVLSYDGTRTFYSETEPVEMQTYMLPGSLHLKRAYANALAVDWVGPTDGSVVRVSFDYAEKHGDTTGPWMYTFILADTKDNKFSFKIFDLHPNQEYAVRVRATYNVDFPFFVWPKDNSFSFKTLTDVPDQPEPPTVSELKTGAYEIIWQEPINNGMAVSQYILEYSESVGGDWMQAYNGSMSRWVVDELLEPGKRYIFRVAAMNANGYGPFSDNSSVFLTPAALMESSMDGETRVVIAVVVCVIFIAGVVIITIICIFMRRRKEEKKKARQFISMHRVPDMELATLRELPHTTVQQSNTLYSINIMPTAEDIAALPHFFRDQLTLTKFLGSGAFGEVFMGVAKDILSDSSGDTKVAVKTLRKSASEHEKEEFLKEALLMSNFRHAHILGLLGVCLDNDPQFIIMELMEGGDLLSFLRSCRATTTSPARLLLPDLVKICVHVARGCKYLEEMHFVHRDLAARNCLVSKKNPSEMVIKIGDFGLARDIYKNDYYRKEGEGLLPVRWMSPESLVDGVFTTPSDIWAFGVLMWEVVTLGQQPYPARTNIEVLQYVRAGGKLDRPDKTADEMFNFMQKCWSFASKDRPSFAYLLQELETFQETCYTMSDEEIAQRSPTHLDALLPRSSQPPTPPQTVPYYGLANLAFDDEVAASGSSTETEEQPRPGTTTCVHQSSHSKRRGGGSTQRSPTSRRNRMTLLGGAETSDKLTVDLSTARPLKSTSSFDSKGSYTDGSQVSYSQIQRQASEMDALGYLQPHCKDMPKYLELLNCAPEMGILQPIPVHPSPTPPSSSIPSTPSTPTTPPAVNYAMMNGNYLIPSPPYGDSPPPPFSKEPALNLVPNGSPPPMYGNPPPTYGVVSVLRNTEKPPPYHSTKEVSLRSLESSPTGRKCKMNPSHSDRDLYATPAFERHLSDSSSSSNSEAGYYCVECSNNSHGSGFPNDKSVPTYSRVGDTGYANPKQNYPYWSNNNSERNYSRNPPTGRKDMFGCPPDYINVNGQARTRNQVFPENASVLAGFDIAQASLV